MKEIPSWIQAARRALQDFLAKKGQGRMRRMERGRGKMGEREGGRGEEQRSVGKQNSSLTCDETFAGR
eukprot:756696-Hanusia_phi.AAC.1